MAKLYQVATVLVWKVEAKDPDEAFKKAIADGPNAISPTDIKSYVNEIGPNGQLMTVQHQPNQPKEDLEPELEESKEEN